MALYEHYNEDDAPDNVGAVVYPGTRWLAQTFTPSLAHRIISVKLLLYRRGLPGTIVVEIRTTDGDGNPTGSVLCSGSIDGDTLPIPWPLPWREIFLGAGANLSAGTMYAIAINGPFSDKDNAPVWRADESYVNYPGGRNKASIDGGVTWYEPPGWEIDLMFEEWHLSIPTPTIDSATDITQNLATLNGTLDDDGNKPCDCGFEWGETVAYGSTTPTGSRITGQTFSQPIVGLLPGTTYHFRPFATNIIGTSYGADRTFTTPIPISKSYALAREEL